MTAQLLQQILEELKGLNQRVGGLENRMGGIENELQDVKSQMNSRFDTIETKMAHTQADVSDIKNSVHRLEMNEPQDTIAMLKQVSRKLDDHQHIQGKVNDLDTDMRIIKRMLTNQ